MLIRDMLDDEELKRRNRFMMQSDPVALDDIREEKRMLREAQREAAVSAPIASGPERLPGQQANAIEQLRNLPATLGMGDLRRIERDMPEISAPPAIGMGDLRLIERDMPETPVPPRPGIGDLRRVERDMPEVPAASPSPPILGMGDLRRMERDEPRPVLPRNPVEQIKNLPTILDSGSPEREGTAPVLVPEDTTKRGYPNPVPVAPPGDVALSQTPNPVTQTQSPTGTASRLDSIRAENQSTLANLERQGNQQIQEFQSFYQDMLSTLDQRRKDLIAQSEKDKGQLDPDTMAAIDRLKADTEDGLRRVKEEANRRGILDSGIALGMELDVNKGFTQNRTYLENSRLKRIKDNLDAALRSLDDRAFNLRTEGAKTTLGARQRLLDVYSQATNQGNQRLDQESRFMRDMGFKQEQSALENLRDLRNLERDTKNDEFDRIYRESQLTGVYNGQPTLEARKAQSAATRPNPTQVRNEKVSAIMQGATDLVRGYMNQGKYVGESSDVGTSRGPQYMTMTPERAAEEAVRTVMSQVGDMGISYDDLKDIIDVIYRTAGVPRPGNPLTNKQKWEQEYYLRKLKDQDFD